MIRSLTGKEVTITLENSKGLGGTILGGFSDTVRFQSSGADTTMYLPMDMIETIEAGGNLWGPIGGLLGGGLAGGVLGGGIENIGSTPGAGFGGIDVSMAALIGGLAGAALGLTVGANVTAADMYFLPPDGIQIAKHADTVTVQVDRILGETDLSVTIPWYSGTTTLPRSQISIQKKMGVTYIRVPRCLLYEDGGPRYIDGHD
jgi:hypothetical protein